LDSSDGERYANPDSVWMNFESSRRTKQETRHKALHNHGAPAGKAVFGPHRSGERRAVAKSRSRDSLVLARLALLPELAGFVPASRVAPAPD
jgi:hypothetical protein